MLSLQEHPQRAFRLALLTLLLALIACNLPLIGPVGEQAARPTATPDISRLPPTAPKVVAQRPYPGEELPLDGSVDIYFDQPMNRQSVEGALSFEPALDVTLTWVDDATLRVTPKAGQLNRAARYKITVGESAQAATGLTMEVPAEVEVQTVGFLEVGEVVPAPNAQGVETDAVITVFFNRPVVPLGIAEDTPGLPQPLTFSPDVPGTGEWINTSIYMWRPSQPLAGATTYTVTVQAGLTDQTGGVLEEPFTWSFTTLPPEIVSVAPAANEVDVARDAVVTVTFNQPMDRQSTEAAFSLTDGNGTPIAGSFEWSEEDRILTFRPAELLPYNGRLLASIRETAQSASGGVTLGTALTWTFDTVWAPAVIGSSPADGEEGFHVWGGIHFFFSAPMDEDTLTEDLVTSNPALPEEATFYYNSYDRSWNINAALEPSTTYTVTLRPGAADPYGTAITQPYTITFTTGPLDPLVQLNTQGIYGLYDANRPTELFVLYRNVSFINFELARISLNQFARLSGPGGWEALENFTPNPGDVVRTWSIPAEGALNEAVYVRVPIVSEQGGSLEPGLYLLTVDAPEVQRIRHFMLVVTANLTYKTSFGEALAWLTDLESGQPLSGVNVRFYDDNFNLFAEGVTGADGTLEVARPAVDYLYQLSYAVAEGQGIFALAMSQWDEGIQPWQFGNIPVQYDAQRYSLYLYTDRPIYRPGQEVFFKGVVRTRDDVTYSLPGLNNVHVVVRDDQGNTIYENDLPLSEMGTFNGSITLDQEAGLGYYNLEVSREDINLYNSIGFQVAEYRKPEFLVTVTPQASQVLAGEEIVVNVSAQFFFGGPVSDAEVQWTVLSDQYFFEYKGPGNYSFYEWEQDQRYGMEFIPGFGEVIAEGEGRTDANGQFVIRLPASLEDVSGSRRFTIEATVTDVNEVSVSGRSEVIVHRGRYYVGVSPDTYIGRAGEPISAALIVVDWESKPVRNQQVTVELVKQVWRNVREEDEFGRTQWTWTLEQRPVGEPITVTTDSEGKAHVTLTPPEGGSYKIRASVTDPQGNTQRGSAFVWISGDEFVVWRQANNDRIDLIADKDTYQPGETAEILIASPFQGQDVQALISIERGSILRYEVITLPSNSYVYRLPITGDLAPNVFVSVVLIKGVDSTNPVPAFKMGLVKIGVDPVEQTIQLTVTPDRDHVGPREEVTYTVEARDFAGQPVDAEVSLALVDLATLSLAPPNSGPIRDHFYGNIGLGVLTAVPMTNLVDRLNQQLFDQGKGGGGGGAEGFFDIRTEFRDTAYWSADVRTGRDGAATVSITLPDNLTTWRMDARAVTADTLVGQAQVDIVATKPLLVRPQTPRFFVANDEATLSAVVHNNTEAPLRARVALQAQGVTIIGAAEQVVDIAAGGRVVVEWPVVVNPDAEWVDLVFSAEGDNLRDASKPPLGDPAHDQMLPVYRYEVPETVGTAGQIVGAGQRNEGVVLPPTYEVTQGNVTVRLDPSLAAATLDGLTWLEHFPYECTEQTVSRFLPNALTMRALRRFGIRDAELENRLNEQISVGLQRLYAQQHVDGGWGWFVESPSNPTVTAYVVQGMVAAREAGYTVEERVLEDALAYLRGQLAPLSTLDEQHKLHTQAYVLYVLALAGEPDASRTVQLYEARQGMQHFARALLAQTLWMIDPADARLETLKSDLVNAAILSASGAHWEEASDDRWNWNTDTRSTAIILDTFARLWPESELAPNITRWLMVARQGSHWETTQETVWALIGLTDWMAATGELDANYTWRFEFNGQTYAEGTVTPETVRQSQVITIDVAQLLRGVVNRFTFIRGEGAGRLYYTAHLTAYLPVEEIDALSRGVIVSRRYLDAQGNPVTEGRVGDVITVEVTIVAPRDLYYVVVEDPFPAGAEAVDVSLLTESVLGEPPVIRPDDPLAKGWGWWWFSQTDLRDEKAVLFADMLPRGTYQYTYQIRLGTVGRFRVIPTVAREFYFPEVYGRGEGMLFTVLPAR